MKKLLTVTMTLFLSFSYSQIEFERGYIVDNAGKWTECFIKNLDWRNNPVDFIYKEQLESIETKTGKLADITEFGVGDVSKYKRFTVNIERSLNDVNNLTKIKNPIWKKETIFLKALVTGDANLYVYVDENLTKYFYETNNIPLEQLVRIRYISTITERGFNESVRENNQFRQQLFNNVKCDKTLEKDFKNIDYNKNDLVSHFSTYNSCSANTVVNYDAKDNRKSYALKITPGFYMASLSIDDPATVYNVSTDVDKAIFKIGIEGEYILPFNKSRWSIFINPTYQQFDVEKSYVKNDGFSNGSQDINYNLTVEYSSIEIPVGARRYFFINTSSKIFANIAYVFDVTKKGSKLTFTNDENLPNATKMVDVKSRNGVSLGVGYTYKRYSLEIRWNSQRQVLSDYLSWSAKYGTTGIIAGFNFL